MNGETVNLSIRMDKSLKEQADGLFSELGMNMTTALNVFVRQSVRQGKIPFEIGLNRPNAETLAAIREIEEMRSGLIPRQSMSVADFAEEMGD
ncbi:MAG: type II toxin-antitoxin system RelB/DinJ family antitoxin [Coriobacteriales bacterium]|jgi:DNA-damage-inducible protein J|nr:type II toxin-antitoxin system RelB/DinJ family antitoxin [Coriobacteriales bacterium]